MITIYIYPYYVGSTMGYNQPQQKVAWYIMDDGKGEKIKCKDCDRVGSDNNQCKRPIFYDAYTKTYIDYYERKAERNFHFNYCASNPSRLPSPNTPSQSSPQQTVYQYRGAPNPNNYTGLSADYENRQPPPQQQGYQPPPQQANNAILDFIVSRLDYVVRQNTELKDDFVKQNEMLQYIYDELIVQIPKLTLAFDNFARDNPAYRAVLEFQARMFPIFNKYLLKTDDEKAGFSTADRLNEIRTSEKERFDKYSGDPGLSESEFREDGENIT